MPQGLSNALATFQRVMDSVMGDLLLLYILMYLDNINVFLKTFSDHLDHLTQVFEQLKTAGLKLKPKKCHFFKENNEFLGFVISKNGIKPVPSKIEAIVKMKSPESMRDIQIFLGMIGYYCRFVLNFASIAEPLMVVLRKDKPFQW